MSSAPISQTVGIGDPDKPANTIQVNDDRSINVVVTSGGGGTSAVNVTQIGGAAVSATSNNIDNIALSGVQGVQEVMALNAVYDSANTVWARWYGNTAGGYMQGNVASGASDSGNPVKVGGRYNSTPPTLTNGQRGDLQLDASGRLLGAMSGSTTPSDNFANPTTAVPTFALAGVWDGSNWDRLAGTSADGALVNLGANNDVTLNAGQNSVGNVGGKTVAVTVTPTVTATNAYGVNYVVGGLLTFSNAFTSAGSGIIQTVTVTIAKVETVAFTLYLFNANPSNTTWTDAAVAAINAADVAKVRPPIALTNASQLGTHTVSYSAGIGEAMNVGSTTLYGVLIVSGALTNQFGSTSDVTVTVTILQDL